MLEYWMQNGEAALLLKHYNGTNDPTETLVKKLLKPLFQAKKDNVVKSNALGKSIFYTIYGSVKMKFPTFYLDKRIAVSKWLLYMWKQKKEKNSRLICTYCGETGAHEIASYIFHPLVEDSGLAQHHLL